MNQSFFKLSGFKISCLVTIIILVMLSFRDDLTFLENIELKTYDYKFRVRGKVDPGKEITIVEIDEKSIRNLGRWPWPRSYFASVVNTLTEMGAMIIVFDVIFSETENNTEMKNIELLEESFLMSGMQDTEKGKEFFNVLQETKQQVNNDYLFALTQQETGNVVQSMFFTLDNTQEGISKEDVEKLPENILSFSLKENIDNNEMFIFSRINSANIITTPIELLATTARSIGHVNTSIDIDGGIRKEILLIKYNQEFFPSLALQTVIAYLDVDKEDIQIKAGDGIYLEEDFFIPMNKTMSMLINYHGPEYTFPTVSLFDVVVGEVDASYFKHKIVLIGAGISAVGLQDLKITPYSTFLSGVEKHANVIHNILHQNYLTRGDWSVYIDIILIIVFGLILGLALPKLPIKLTILLPLSLGLIYLIFIEYMFIYKGIDINVVYPLLEIIFVYTAVTIYNYMTEEKQKKFIQNAFAQYLSPEVINNLIKDPSKLKLGGERKVLTAFFSDVAGFSAISEKLSPEELVELLNIYLTEMTDIIMKYGGTVDKFEGDAIIAFYGAPLSFEDHATKACLTAIDMQKKLNELRLQWKSEGRPELFVRIGLNTGPMVVGNMGSKNRMDYTMMGDSVNLASRLEGVNKQYGTYTIIGESTFNESKSMIVARELDVIRVVGKKEPTVIYELIGRKGEVEPRKIEITEIFQKGLSHYKNQHWDEAIKCFSESLEIDENDAPSMTFLERCLEFQASPSFKKTWDGVHEMKTK